VITKYHRPRTLNEALKILKNNNSRLLAGGTLINQHHSESFEVIDLQALGLDKLHKAGETLKIGAMVTLQNLIDSEYSPEALKTTLKLEAPLNLRNMATVAGALVSCDGRSPFTTAMLALDAKMILNDDPKTGIRLGDMLPIRAETLHGKIITAIHIAQDVTLAYRSVARTPSDRPILCAALAIWSSGRARLVLGGWGSSPTLAMDGSEASGLELSARNAASEAEDEWGTAEYRQSIAPILAMRCLKESV
jgi:CO/xanthine dehydrogenase FAD-binding subunit